MTSDGLAAFRAEVIADRGLQRALLEHDDESTFPARVAELAADRGHVVAAIEVAEALVAARRAWLERWV